MQNDSTRSSSAVSSTDSSNPTHNIPLAVVLDRLCSILQCAEHELANSDDERENAHSIAAFCHEAIHLLRNGEDIDYESPPARLSWSLFEILYYQGPDVEGFDPASLEPAHQQIIGTPLVPYFGISAEVSGVNTK